MPLPAQPTNGTSGGTYYYHTYPTYRHYWGSTEWVLISLLGVVLLVPLLAMAFYPY